MATMREVAHLAGVSAKTVSRVLRNDRYVSDDVRDRVNAAVAELKYTPNTLAVTFRSGRDAAIGVAVPDIADPFFAQIIQAIESVARVRSTAVIVSSLGYDPAGERPAIEALLQRQVSGLISCPVADDQRYLTPWLARTPVVFIDRAPHKLTADSVIEDDIGGAQTATRHLLQHGHRRIAFVGDDHGAATTRNRLDGYRQIISEAGLPVDNQLIYLGGTDPQSMDALLRHLAGLKKPPTAVFCSNARSTQALVPALQRSDELRMAIVSFGDFPLAAALRPPLTVIDQNPSAVGKFAAERLFARIDNPDKRLRRRNVLPVALIERDSCHQTVGGTGDTAS